MAVPDLTDQLHRYTINEYEELVVNGAFEDHRVELIDGLVLDMRPKSPAHENAVDWLHRWLVRHVDLDRYDVRVGSPLLIGISEPEPDLAVVDRDRPRDRHPLSAHLVIEVVFSSRERDLAVKPRLYAAAVAEYWVFDLERKHVVAHRQPGAVRYRKVMTFGADDLAGPEHLELPPFSVADLLDAI
jgi:Uma2 family endonuclease